MKVAVSASGPDLDSPVDPRFGRCANYLIVDTESMEFEVLENAAAMQGSGAGIAAAQLVAQTGAEAVISGNVGPNAFQTLSAGNIPVYTGATGTVREAIAAFNAGQLQATGGANVDARAGMGSAGASAAPGAGIGPGMGMGAGMGRGMGGGMGRGMGMGGQMGAGQGAVPPPGAGQGAVPPPGAGQQMPSPMMPGMGGGYDMPPMMAPGQFQEQQLQMLKNQAIVLQQQLDLVNLQIEHIEQSLGAGDDTQ